MLLSYNGHSLFKNIVLYFIILHIIILVEKYNFMKSKIFPILVVSIIAFACSKEESGDPMACKNQSTDFQSCLSCCEDNGFSGASLPMDDNGNYLECECKN